MLALTPCPFPHDNAALAERLVRMIHVCRGTAESEALFASVLEQAIERHFVDAAAPAWMIDFFDRLLAGATTYEAVAYPSGYPDGENGLVNILADVERHVGWLGIDDEGEHLEWPLPSLGVRLHLNREGSAVYRIRPWSGAWAERSTYDGSERRGVVVEGRWAGTVRDVAPDGQVLREVEIARR